jgi:hypothetical protein
MPTIHVVEINPHAPRPFVFTDMALCLVDALRRAGLGAEHSVNEPPPEGLCIVLGWSVAWLDQHAARLHRQRLVLFNAEPLAVLLADRADPATAAQLAALGHWVLADAHDHNLALLQQALGPALRAVLLPIPPGPAVVFAGDTPPVQDIDVLFYGAIDLRRQQVIVGLRSAGLVVETVAGAYAWELAPLLQRARLVLHVHFGSSRLLPVARLLQPVAAGVPVVCETAEGAAAEAWRPSGIVFADHADLVPACVALLADSGRQLQAVQRSLRCARTLDVAGPLQALRALLSAPLDLPAQIAEQLRREATELPPEAHLPAPPLVLVQRQPGQTRVSRWGLWLLLIVMLVSLWRAVPG